MPAFTIFFGIALMAVGIGTYAASDEQPMDMLLPALMGLVLLGLGVEAIVKNEHRKHLMHGAVLLATLGVLVPLGFLLSYLVGMDREKVLQMLWVLLTVAFSAAYVYAAIQSFRAARRTGKDGTPDPPRGLSDPAEPTGGA